MLYFDILPEDLLRILLIKDKILYKVSKSFLKLYMKMLEDLSTNDINPDMYFRLLDVNEHKIPQRLIDRSNELYHYIINGNYESLSGRDIKNILIDIDRSVEKVYYYYYRYVFEESYLFIYLCKTGGSYTLIEYQGFRSTGCMIIYFGRSWKSLVDSYKDYKRMHIIREYIFNYMLRDNGYDINYISSSLNRNIEYFTTFLKLSL